MAFRNQALLALSLMAAPAATAAEFRFPARHDHLRKGCSGELMITGTAVEFHGVAKKKPHVFRWPARDIQQLSIGSGEVRVLIYEDARWRLGADREFTFRLAKDADLEPVWLALQSTLDQRLVGAVAQKNVKPMWTVAAKHLGAIRGSQGTLLVGSDRIVYESAGDSHTWRYSDIEWASSSSPFELTLTTYERSRAHYGSRKEYRFQLKEPVADSRMEELWRRLSAR